LEFNPKNKALKSRGNPRMKSRGLVLRAVAGDANTGRDVERG
jgi:hypothetical protein